MSVTEPDLVVQRSYHYTQFVEWQLEEVAGGQIPPSSPQQIAGFGFPLHIRARKV